MSMVRSIFKLKTWHVECKISFVTILLILCKFVFHYLIPTLDHSLDYLIDLLIVINLITYIAFVLSTCSCPESRIVTAPTVGDFRVGKLSNVTFRSRRYRVKGVVLSYVLSIHCRRYISFYCSDY